MSITLKTLKIDPRGKGVTGLPDTPGLSTAEMQVKFDELPLLCAERINDIVDDFESVNDSIDSIHKHDNLNALRLLSMSDEGEAIYDGKRLATTQYVNNAITELHTGGGTDSIFVSDTTNAAEYIIKLRLINGKPVVEYTEI